jgi:hypothetical protein
LQQFDTIFGYEVNALTGKGKHVNLLQLAEKTREIYFWQVLGIWNHCVLQAQDFVFKML